MISRNEYFMLARLYRKPIQKIIIFIALKVVFDGIPGTNQYISVIRYPDNPVPAMRVGECKYLFPLNDSSIIKFLSFPINR